MQFGFFSFGTIFVVFYFVFIQQTTRKCLLVNYGQQTAGRLSAVMAAGRLPAVMAAGRLSAVMTDW